jgi:hypothetical protein
MPRMKTYDAPHKGLRNALSQLQLLSGKADFNNAAEVEHLFAFGQDVFKLLNIHADDENEVTLAELEKRCPGCSVHDRSDHELLESEQRSVEELLLSIYSRTQNGQGAEDLASEFYLLLSKYHGDYLLHLNEEETVTQLLLWKHFTDEELLEHRIRIIRRNPPETLLIWLRFIIPAQPHVERVRFFGRFKKTVPEDLYSKALDVVRQELPTKEFDSLYEAIQREETP